MSKNIIVYTDDHGVYGVARINHLILNELVKQGYQVVGVQTKTSNPLVTSQMEMGIKHIWLKFDTAQEFGKSLNNHAEVKIIFTSAQADLVIFNDCCPFSNFAAKQVAMEMGIPYIAVIGFVAPYLAKRFADYLEQLYEQYNQAETVIAVSQENLKLLHQLFRLPQEKGKVIYYGRPEEYFIPRDPSVRESLRQEFGIPLDAVVCFTASRLVSVKGYQYQLEAIKHLK